MKLMPREDFNELNEAIVGIKRLGYTFEDLNESELQEFIKYLLLLSGSGSSTVCESYIIKTLVDGNIGITESQLENIDIPQILLENEFINEGDWLSTVDTGVKVGAATGVAAVAGIGAYISFLFKKKKIRKAMEATRDAKIAKLDQDKENYDELEKLKPILTKEEGTDKIKNIEDKVSKDKESLKTFDADIDKEKTDVKTKIDQTKMKMQELGDRDFKDYQSEDSKLAAQAKADKEEKAAKDKADKEHELKVAQAGGEGGEGEENSSLDPLAEAEKKDKKKDEKKGGEEEAFGKLGVAQQALKKAKENEEQSVKKATEKNSEEIKKIVDDNKKLTTSKKSNEDKKKAKEKNSERKKKLSEENKKLKDEGTGEVPKAKSKVEDIKGQIESRKLELTKLNQQKSDLVDPAKVDAKKNKIKDNIDDASSKIDDVKKDMQPQGTTKEREAVKIAGEKKITKMKADIAAAEMESGRVSGTSTDEETGKTKSDSLIGKATGFEAGYVKKLAGQHQLEILQKEQDILNQMDDAKAAKAAVAKEAKAKEKIKDGDKEFKSQKDKTDASDGDMKKAEDGVAAKEKEREAEDAKRKEEADEAKRTGIQKQIEGLEKSIKEIKDKKKKDKDVGLLSRSPDKKKKKEEYQYKIDRFKTKLDKAKEALSKVGESFQVKFMVATLVSEFNELVKEYDIILEGRKELTEEKEEKPKKKEKEEDKVKPDTDTMDTPADPENIPGDEEEPEKKAKKEESNPLIGKKVTITNMTGTDQAHLEGAEGKITYAWKENERAPEGDMPRRAGDAELFTIEFNKPKDPMYPEIQLSKDKFKESKKDEKKEEKVDESIADKFRRVMNENHVK